MRSGADDIAVEPVPWMDAAEAVGLRPHPPAGRLGLSSAITRLAAPARPARASGGWPVANPVPLLRWNSDKSYLEELAAKGVDSVPSLTVAELDEAHLDEARAHFGCETLVVKPLVSASAYGTYRLGRAIRCPMAFAGGECWSSHGSSGSSTAANGRSCSSTGVSATRSPRCRPGEFRVQPEYRRDHPARAIRPTTRSRLARGRARRRARGFDLCQGRIVVGNDGQAPDHRARAARAGPVPRSCAPQAGARFAAAVRSAALRARQ